MLTTVDCVVGPEITAQLARHVRVLSQTLQRRGQS
jgi:hypothetical protein